MPGTGWLGISRLSAMVRWRPAEGSHDLFLLACTMGTKCTQWDGRLDSWPEWQLAKREDKI